MSYDYLVLGLGAEVNFFGAAGAPEHAFPMYTLADAVRLKEHVLEKWEAADKDDSLAEDGATAHRRRRRRPDRGGERRRAGRAVQQHLRRGLPGCARRSTRGSRSSRPRRSSSGCSRRSSASTPRRTLEEYGVDVLLGEIVESVEPTRVRLKSGKVLEAHTLVWGAGLHGEPDRARPRGRARAGQPCRRRAGPQPGRAIRRCSRSATSPGSRTRRPTRCSRSSARSRSRQESRRGRTSPASSPARRRSPSSTTTRARWRRSAAARPWCSSRVVGR